MSKQSGVFISHSFENKDQFHNIADALAQAGVAYWNPDDVKPGSSLRDQLRQAVGECSVCVFVATRRALKSSWCGAELGAFWGAGKPIIVYLADSELKNEELPPVVQDDVWEGKIKKIVERAGELARAAAAAAGDPDSAPLNNLTAGDLKKLIVAAVSLSAADSKSDGDAPSAEKVGRAPDDVADSVVGGMKAVERKPGGAESWRKHVLWVDDIPSNNFFEREALESMGLKFTLAISTQEALDKLSKERFAAVISDIGRPEGPKAGFVLLDAMRASGDRTPFFIYAGSKAVKERDAALARGAQGSTNNPYELINMVTEALS